MSRVVHFEIPANDTKKVADFFSKTFGWKFSQFGTEDYWMAETGDAGKPGINGSIMKRRDPAQPVVNSIQVDNIDAMADKVSKNGGVIVVPKFPIPHVGWLSYFKDPDGNIHGIWQDDPSAK